MLIENVVPAIQRYCFCIQLIVASYPANPRQIQSNQTEQARNDEHNMEKWTLLEKNRTLRLTGV